MMVMMIMIIIMMRVEANINDNAVSEIAKKYFRNMYVLNSHQN
jgi:hypothetical protein